jgi:hypothetical protein
MTDQGGAKDRVSSAGGASTAELQIRLFEEIAGRLDRIEEKLDKLTEEDSRQRERLVKLETQHEHADPKGVSEKTSALQNRMTVLETRVGPLFAVITMALSGLISWIVKSN